VVLDTIKLLLLVKAVCKLDHVEELQSFKLSKSIKKKRQNTHNQKWAVLSIASIPLIMTLWNSMFIPVLTEMQKQLNISTFKSSMIITVYSIVAILLIPIAGYLSDHIGRKKVIIPSLLITGIGGLISGWAAWKMVKIDFPHWSHYDICPIWCSILFNRNT
jgi:ACDE family multidrug resistance protein